MVNYFICIIVHSAEGVYSLFFSFLIKHSLSSEKTCLSDMPSVPSIESSCTSSYPGPSPSSLPLYVFPHLPSRSPPLHVFPCPLLHTVSQLFSASWKWTTPFLCHLFSALTLTRANLCSMLCLCTEMRFWSGFMRMLRSHQRQSGSCILIKSESSLHNLLTRNTKLATMLYSGTCLLVRDSQVLQRFLSHFLEKDQPANLVNGDFHL